ncbi:MAG: flagellar motor switch protein FliN [Terriglobales bacterium]|jgi:flagellar motor switch protein FliN
MTGDPVVPPSASPSPPPEGGGRQFSQVWADSLAQVLGQIAGTPLPVENLAEVPTDVPPPDANDLQLLVVAAGALRGEMSLRIPLVSALGLAQLFLGEAQDAAVEMTTDHRQALEELVRQVAGYVATGAKPRWGEVQFQVETTAAPSWAAGASGWLGSAGSTPCRVWVEWKLSAALHAALVAASQPKADAPADAPATTPNRLPKSDPAVEGNLDLLMDVALEVTLRFGERNLLLREILELGAGSVVELDRKVGEPADLLLDGRIVARGEVVVVDGNYGLRVLEVITPAAGVLRGEA